MTFRSLIHFLPDFNDSILNADRIVQKTPNSLGFPTARDSTYEEGFQKGYLEGAGAEQAKWCEKLDSDEKRLYQKVLGQLEKLAFCQHHEQQIEFRLLKETLELTSAVIQKIFPNLLQSLGKNSIQKFVETMSHQFLSKDGVTVQVSPQDYESLSIWLLAFQEQSPVSVALEACSSISPNSCQIQWKSGKASWNPDDLVNSILSYFESILHTIPQLPHSNEGDY